MWWSILLNLVAVCQVYCQTCNEPAPVFNAYRNATSYWENVNYTCYEGFAVTSGNLLRTCGNDGNFTGQPPTCSPTCRRPSMPLMKFENSTYAGTSAGSINASCVNPGNWLSGVSQQSLSCNSDTREWEWDRGSPDACIRAVVLSNDTQNDGFGNVTDNNNNTCLFTTDWTARLSGLTYISRVFLELRIEGPSSIRVILKVIQQSKITVCEPMTSTPYGYSGYFLVYGNIICNNGSNGAGGSPLGDMLNLTVEWNGTRPASRFCTILAYGSPKIDYCPPAPLVPGLKLLDTRTTYYATDAIVRYACHGGRVPFRGEDLAMCNVTSGIWTRPTLQCTEAPDFHVQKVNLPKIYFQGVIINDGDHHTCVDVTIPQTAQPVLQLLLTLSSVIEVDVVRLVLPLFRCPAVAMAVVSVPQSDGAVKNCTSFSAEVTYNRTNVLITCPYSPVARNQSLMVTVLCEPASSYPAVCEVAVFGRTYHDPGIDYKGTMSITTSGFNCLRWDSFADGPFTRPDMFPDGSLSEARNFCRNPNGSRVRPWCYVTSNKDWDLCIVPVCDSFCSVDDDEGLSYIGTKNVTAEGDSCISWTSFLLPPFAQEDFPSGSLDHNHCRNPNGTQSAPWCYVNTADRVTPKRCIVPPCGTGAVMTHTEDEIDQRKASTNGVISCFLQSEDGFVQSEVSWSYVKDQSVHDNLCLEGIALFCSVAAQDAYEYFVALLDCGLTTTAANPSTASSPIIDVVTSNITAEVTIAQCGVNNQSCVGHCGSNPSRLCSCMDSCLTNNICCCDYTHVCMRPAVPTTASTAATNISTHANTNTTTTTSTLIHPTVATIVTTTTTATTTAKTNAITSTTTKNFTASSHVATNTTIAATSTFSGQVPYDVTSDAEMTDKPSAPPETTTDTTTTTTTTRRPTTYLPYANVTLGERTTIQNSVYMEPSTTPPKATAFNTTKPLQTTTANGQDTAVTEGNSGSADTTSNSPRPMGPTTAPLQTSRPIPLANTTVTLPTRIFSTQWNFFTTSNSPRPMGPTTAPLQTSRPIPLANTTVTLPTRIFPTQWNFCTCRLQTKRSPPISQRELDALQKNLTVPKETTSGYLRKKTSATDNRVSSVTIGIFGIVCIFSVVAFFIAPDLIFAARFIWSFCAKGACTGESKKETA